MRCASSKETETPKVEPQIDLSINAYLQRAMCHRHGTRCSYISYCRLSNEEDVADVADDLIDRYGDPPSEVVALLEVARLKSLAREWYCGLLNGDQGI